MENTDIPQFHTYRGEIEFEGTLIQADIFIDNKMLEDKNSFLISFLCKSNTIYKMVCRNVLKKEGYYINLKFNGVNKPTTLYLRGLQVEGCCLFGIFLEVNLLTCHGHNRA